ncbi:MAG: hypothetical protein ACTSXL_05855 [Alphaproteobacteria bacterium]
MKKKDYFIFAILFLIILGIVGMFFLLKNNQSNLENKMQVNFENLEVGVSANSEKTATLITKNNEREKINTDNFATKNELSEITIRLEKLEKNNSAKQIKQILSLYTIINLKKNIENQSSFAIEVFALKKAYPSWAELEILEKTSKTGLPSFETMKKTFYEILEKKKSKKTEEKITKKNWLKIIKERAINLIVIKKKNKVISKKEDIIIEVKKALERKDLSFAITKISQLEMTDEKTFLLFKNWLKKAKEILLVNKVIDEIIVKITNEFRNINTK